MYRLYMRALVFGLRIAAACGLAACGPAGFGPARPPLDSPPAAEVILEDLDVVLDADAVPAIFTAARAARATLRGAPPAFGPRVAAAWETAVAEARVIGVDVAVGPAVAGGALAVLVADSTAVLARCDIAEGGRGATLILKGPAVRHLEAPPPWRLRGPGIEFLDAWPARIDGPVSAVIGAGEATPPALLSALGPGSRLLAAEPPEGLEADVRRGPDPPGYAGILVLGPSAAYIGLGAGGVARIDDPALLEALAAYFDEILWPAAPPADLDDL